MLSPQQVIDEYYLSFRLKLLEIGAIMDRLDRAAESHGGTHSEDPRWSRCLQAMELLNDASASPDRAEQIALIFSDPPIHE